MGKEIFELIRHIVESVLKGESLSAILLVIVVSIVGIVLKALIEKWKERRMNTFTDSSFLTKPIKNPVLKFISGVFTVLMVAIAGILGLAWLLLVLGIIVMIIKFIFNH